MSAILLLSYKLDEEKRSIILSVGVDAVTAAIVATASASASAFATTIPQLLLCFMH